jgi:hypothetical protein
VNQVTMEEAQNAPTMIPGTSLINSILSAHDGDANVTEKLVSNNFKCYT